MNRPTDLPKTPEPSSGTLDLPEGSGERGGIRRRFVVAISSLVALVLTIQGAVLILFGHRYLEAQIEQEADAYATLAVAPICDAYRKYFDSGYTKFQELVHENLSLAPDLEALAIYDTEGRRLFRSEDLGEGPRPAEEGTPARLEPGSRLLEAVKGLEKQSWESRREGHRHYVVVAPYVEEWGRHQYSVVFWVSYDSLTGAMMDIGWRILGLALLSLLLGGVCAWVLSAQSLRPVETLTEGARRFARGDLDHRNELRSGDEFEILGNTMDHMAALLARTVEDLESSNRHLELLNRELQELDEVKSDLLANVSHELRTPLTAIRGYVEAMSTGLLGDVSEVQQESLEVVERNIARLRSMIDQLLSYSRMESGRLEVELKPFDLESTARHVVEAVGAARDAASRLVLDCEEDLPEAFGDAGRIAQVLENLLTNAVKFSPDETAVELLIRRVRRTDGEGGDDGLEVRVRDHGIGIPLEEQTKIFDRFFQVDAGSSRHYGGMGLGLAIVREILELHHSKIEVDSAPGEGATFRFVLGLAADRTSLLPVGAGRHLVFVDDDASFVQAMAAHLAEHDWVVHAAATASQGMALVRKVEPEAVILDRLLPDRDGFDLLQELKEDGKTSHVPVVLCTVRRERGLGLRLGAAEYWIKPIEPADLEARLEDVLDSRSPERSPEGTPRQQTEETREDEPEETS